MEELVLARANGLAQASLGGEVDRFEPGSIAADGPRFQQLFTGALHRGGEARAFAGRHLLGFAGPSREAVLCTAACTEPASGHACADLVARVTPEGAWVGAPPPAIPIRAILLAAEHPNAALGVGAALSLAAIAVILARRPRPRY